MRRLSVVAVAALLAGFYVITGAPAEADESEPCKRCKANVAPTDTGDLLVRVRAGYEELNRAAADPQPCTFIDRRNGEQVERTGIWRWRSPANENAVWHSVRGTKEEEGRYWRRECYDETLGEEFGDYDEVRLFPITPENLARLAVDDFLVELPSPSVHSAPANRTLVNLDTWFWVDGVDGGERTSGVVSVPGMAVVATARAATVHIDTGDGTAGVTCQIEGMPYSADLASAPPCAHVYRRSSIGQPNEAYQGAARVVWSATYTVNGAGPFEVEEATTRQTPFAIQVAERQTLNR